MQAILDSLLPTVLVVLTGFLWARQGLPYDIPWVSRLVTHIGAPALIVATLGEVDLPLAAFGHFAGLSLLTLALTAVGAWLWLRLRGLSLRACLPSLLFANTGNLGLPVVLFAFGEHGLALALVFFTLSSLLTFSLGTLLVSGEQRPEQLLRSPILLATVAAVLLLATDTALPLWAGRTLGLLGDIAIPLMLLTLGVSLAQLRLSDLPTSGYLAAGRLLLGLTCGWAVASAFGLTGAAKGALVLQSAMPVAVFNYLLAARYERAPQMVAGAIVLSTTGSLVLLPLLLGILL